MPGPDYHGRTHAAGGTDPIPPGSGDLDQTSPYQPLNVLLSEVLGFDDDWGAITLDSTIYGGGKRTISVTGIGKWVAFPCVLGPKGSVWSVTFVHGFASNFGIAAIEWASSSQDGLPGATGNEGPGFMQEPYDVTFVPTGASQDGYSGTPSDDNVVQRNGYMRIGGNPGDVLTAMTIDPVSGANLGDGGPGLYWVRFLITGKNASSSGYGYSLQYVAAERVPGG